ncbi:MAG: methyltransferase domain-containing protein [ANME-2 cluster archaeon]|nr:methyltransferase domain-containing protein [ANME-2 cluster archaeon]
MQKLRDTKQETKAIIDLLHISRDQNVLELGTGTGEFAIEAARHCATLHAVDVSPAMLDHARQKAKLQGISNIRFHHAGFLTYEHQDEPLDVVVSQLAMHHLPDFWKLVALRRIFEMLKKGGRFYLMDIVYSFEPGNYEDFFYNWIENVGQATGEEMAQDTAMAIQKEFQTFDWVIEGLLKRAGFHVEKAEYYEGFIAVYLCTCD